MRPKITPKENLGRDMERGWYGCVPRHGGIVPKVWLKPPRTGKAALACHLAQPDRATSLPRPLVPVFVARLCYVCSIPWDFRAALFRGLTRLLGTPFC